MSTLLPTGAHYSSIWRLVGALTALGALAVPALALALAVPPQGAGAILGLLLAPIFGLAVEYRLSATRARPDRGSRRQGSPVKRTTARPTPARVREPEAPLAPLPPVPPSRPPGVALDSRPSW